MLSFEATPPVQIQLAGAPSSSAAEPWEHQMGAEAVEEAEEAGTRVAWEGG